MSEFKGKWCRVCAWALDWDDYKVFKLELSLGDRNEWWSDTHNRSISLTVGIWKWFVAIAIPGWRIR